MKFVWVRADVLRNVHRRLIETYGGLDGVRDENALESAIARPEQMEAYGGVQSVAQLGAALGWAILRNHPFTDGNKRAAFAALMIFLSRNGHRMTCSEVEETAMVLRAAASEISEQEWTAWVERSVARIAE
ncbi:MAG TPA: type II toxin-antitoxin system death-on-curing family toxin [Acidobacteriaceae bacterium]